MGDDGPARKGGVGIKHTRDEGVGFRQAREETRRAGRQRD
jgi:hypothetical protein